MSENNLEILKKQAADFNIGSLIGRPWSEINDVINQHKENGFFIEKINKSRKFQEYCHNQAEQFLKRRVALTKKDFESIKLLWLYGNLELDDILLIKDRIEGNDYTHSDRFRDFDRDKNMRLFAQNVPAIKEELEKPGHSEPSIRRKQRQRLNDFVRFIESGNKSRELLKNGDWKSLIDNFEHFPQIKSEVIIDLYKKEKEKNPDSERIQMMSRLFIYRLEDIDNGKWELRNLSELDAIEGFIKESMHNSDDERISRILNKISEVRETLKNKSAKKASQPLIIDEEIEDTDNSLENLEDKTKTDKETEDKSQPQPQKTETETHSENSENSDNKKKESEDSSIPLKDEKESEANASWQQETLKNWKDWAQDHDKRIETYAPEKAPNDLAFKIYSNKEDADKDKAEADIHYKEQNHIVVKGKPGNDVFDGIVAMAKKNGNQITFGNIKSDEFKARLMLACLKDGEIEMINAPKIEDLQNISVSLKEALKDPHKKKIENIKEKKTKEPAGNETKSRQDHRNGNRRPRREFTEEEKKAYRSRQIREAALHSH